jgi:hypothetical protein
MSNALGRAIMFGLLALLTVVSPVLAQGAISTVAGQIDVSDDATACAGSKGIVFFGSLGDFSSYRGCAQSNAGSTGTAVIDASGLSNVWFNIVWTNGTTGGHPGYGSSGGTDVERTWNAAGDCGVTADDHSDATCP